MKLQITLDADLTDDPKGWLDSGHAMGLSEKGYSQIRHIFPFGVDDIDVKKLDDEDDDG